MVYSYWLFLELGQGPGPGPGRMGCMVLRRTFHTVPEQGQGRKGYVPIFQGTELFQVMCFNDISITFRCLVLVPDTASVNSFCIISVPVPETANVSIPLVQKSPYLVIDFIGDDVHVLIVTLSPVWN